MRRSTGIVLYVAAPDDNRDMYATYLAKYNFTVLTADTTDEGLTRAADAEVIVTGIRVPGTFDGVELVGRLRSNHSGTKPIIVLTACALEPDRQRALDAGCDVFLPMPCLPDRLLREIRTVLPRHRVPRPQPERRSHYDKPQDRRAS
jgi:two-component system cell cycle response regulator DivK